MSDVEVLVELLGAYTNLSTNKSYSGVQAAPVLIFYDRQVNELFSGISSLKINYSDRLALEKSINAIL